MEYKDKIENYWKTYQIINEWIRFSDTKAAIIITVYGVIITIIYTNANNVYDGLISSNFRIFVAIISVITSLFSIYKCFKCLNPSLTNSNPNSIHYFGHISTHSSFHDYKNYAEQILNDDDATLSQITEQVYTNSTIAWKKFINVTYSIRLFFVSVIQLLFILILYFLKL